MTLFRLDASFRVQGSHSRALGDLVELEWTTAYPGDDVIRRDVGTQPLPADVWAHALAAAALPEEERTAEHRSATALATTLVDELAAADALVFDVPLYNYGVSQHFKAYVDLVVTEPRMALGETVVAGKPAVLVAARGGAYGAGTPREGWDHATPWIRRMLADVWQLDLRVVAEEFTLVGVNPALDSFADLAATMRSDAARLAADHGRSLVATPKAA